MLEVLNSAEVNAETWLAVCHVTDLATSYNSAESSWQLEIVPQRQRGTTGPVLVLAALRQRS